MLNRRKLTSLLCRSRQFLVQGWLPVCQNCVFLLFPRQFHWRRSHPAGVTGLTDDPVRQSRRATRFPQIRRRENLHTTKRGRPHSSDNISVGFVIVSAIVSKNVSRQRSRIHSPGASIPPWTQYTSPPTLPLLMFNLPHVDSNPSHVKA